MMRSLRTRLLAGIIGGMVFLLTVFSLLLYTVIAGNLVSQFDASLTSIAQILAGSVERDGDQIEMDLDVQQMPEFQDAGQPTYYVLRRPDGTIVAKSPLLGARDLPRLEGSGQTPVFTACRTGTANLNERLVSLLCPGARIVTKEPPFRATTARHSRWRWPAMPAIYRDNCGLCDGSWRSHLPW